MGSIKVIKIGGNVVDNPALLGQFVKDFAALNGPRILVHGGGKMASQLQKALGQEPVMIEGRRVTDEDTLKVVTMVYAGWCNKQIVALLQKENCNALGLCGADANVITASKRPPVHRTDAQGNESVTDYGYVGDIDPADVDVQLLGRLTDNWIVPVFSAITHDMQGHLLNTNADTVASTIAVALARYGMDVTLTYCFEKDGVLYDKDDDNSVIERLTYSDYALLKEEGRVAAGMIPKLDNSFKALASGVREVIIKHARNLLSAKGTTLILDNITTSRA